MAISEETYVTCHDVQLCLAFSAIAGDAQAETMRPESIKRAIMRRMHDLDASWNPSTEEFGFEWREAVLPPCDSMPVTVDREASERKDKDPLHGAGAPKVHAVIEVLTAALRWHQGRLDAGEEAQGVLDKIVADFVAVMAGAEPREAYIPPRLAKMLEEAV